MRECVKSSFESSECLLTFKRANFCKKIRSRSLKYLPRKIIGRSHKLHLRIMTVIFSQILSMRSTHSIWCRFALIQLHTHLPTYSPVSTEICFSLVGLCNLLIKLSYGMFFCRSFENPQIYTAMYSTLVTVYCWW